jgi:hypothetical protein
MVAVKVINVDLMIVLLLLNLKKTNKKILKFVSRV